MKLNYSLLSLFLIGIISCNKHNPKVDCTAPVQATVRDLTNLDGCGFVFELSDGKRLEPFRLLYCGTPPLPKEITEDPLYGFEFIDGKKVLIGYSECTDCASNCTVGTMVKIACISEDTPIGNSDE